MIDHAPEVEWPEFGDLEFVRPVLDIDEAMIDVELEEQRFEAGTAAPSQEPLAHGDQAMARLELALAETGEPLAEPIDVLIRVPAAGRPALAGGLAITGLDDAIRGCVAGDHRTFESIVPTSLGNTSRGGEPMQCVLAVLSTERVAAEGEGGRRYVARVLQPAARREGARAR